MYSTSILQRLVIPRSQQNSRMAAGTLDFADAVRTVRSRGKYMQEAVPVGVGAMAAILGADIELINAVCAEAAQGEVCSAANINSPAQVVIAGSAGAIDRAMMLLRERGAKRAIKLKVSAPFHCTLMKPAQDRLAIDLQNVALNDAKMPVVTNVDAAAQQNGVKLRDSLVRQVSQPVRWLESVEFLINQGVQTFIEIGPGKVLSGLVRQIDRNVRCVNVESESSLRAAREAVVI